MKAWKFRVLSISLTGTVLLAGLLPGCSSPDNPKIPEVPNLKELESKSEKTGPPIVRGKVMQKGEGYMKAMDPELRGKQ
jgi:hypothetical protein